MLDDVPVNDRIYPSTPRVGVGVVVFDGDRFLLIKRGQEPARGLWTVPGGLVELGETLENAVHRELYEECGIYVKLLDIVDYFEFFDTSDNGQMKYHYIVIEFLALFTNGTLQASSDAEQARWFLRDDLNSLATTEKTISLIDKALTKYNLAIQA